MRHLCIVILSIMLSTSIFAQQNNSLTELRATKAVSLQFETIPSAKKIEQLSSKGITLKTYLGNNSYLAIARQKIDLNSMANEFGFFQILNKNINAELLQDIKADHIPNYAKHSDGTVDVAITFSDELSREDLNAFIAQNDGKLIRSFSNGQVAVFNVSKNKVQNIIDEPFVQNIEFEEEEVARLNYENKIVQGAHYVHQTSIPGMELDGSGIVVGVGDGGNLGEHIDFENALLEETTEYATNFGDHGDHVAGTIASKGNLDPRQSGFAPGAGLIIEKTSNVFYKSREYYDDYGMVLTNNSYGSSFNCDENGAYNYTSFELDKQLREMPHLMHVFAAGNNGAATCSGFPKGYQTVLKYYGAAKNVLTVGSVDENLEIANSSSRGPAKDGRLKPEVCGVGVNVLSNGREYDYHSMSGTSMAAPSVTGSMALMYQKYEQNTGEIARGDLMKAIVCNTADDLGVKGPDYKYGFGLVNAFRAINAIEDERYFLGQVENAATTNHSITVGAGVVEAKFLLYWNDKETTSNPDKALVNNLDFQIITPTGEVILPWVLNHESNEVNMSPSRKVDGLNNIEQVTISNPVPGEYTLVVKGTEVPFGPQEFAVTYEVNEEEVNLLFPAGKESLVPNDQYNIVWAANMDNENTFKLELSLDNGLTWDLLVDQIPANHRTYKWRTPETITQCAKMRISVNNTGLTDTHDATFNILGKPKNVLAIPVCKETIRLVWEDVDNAADSYIVYMLKEGKMEVFAETTQKYADLEFNFEEGKDYWFSVANKSYLGNLGERTKAISAQSWFDHPCDRENDGKVVDIFGMLNGREFTSISLGEEGVGVLIQNNGSNELTHYNVSMRVNNQGALKEKFTGVLPSGGEQLYTFENRYDFSEVGSYSIDTWISHPLDDLHYNDSLVGQFEVNQLPNEPVQLPMTFDFEEEEFYYFNTQIGLGDLTHFDFVKGDASASASVGVNGNTKYLSIENNEQSSGEGNSYMMTLNMSEYDTQKGLMLDFDAKVASENLTESGALWLRGSDQDTWIRVMYLDNAMAWEKYADIDINSILNDNNQNLSTSTQVKFTFSAAGMVAIDNVTIRAAENNVATEQAKDPMATVYPNLVQNDFNLDIQSEKDTSAKIAIVNSNGQIVREMEENLVFGENNFTFSDLSNQPSGMYFITIEVEGQREVQKLTKASK